MDAACRNVSRINDEATVWGRAPQTKGTLRGQRVRALGPWGGTGEGEQAALASVAGLGLPQSVKEPLA